MHNYDAFTDEEIEDLGPDGQYQAEIMQYHYETKYGEPLLSTKGVPMVKVILNVLTPDRPREVTDFILLNKQWGFKFKHLCDSIGRLKDYMEKTLEPNFFVGAMTWVDLGRQEAKNGYRARNSVNYYVKLEDQPKAGENAAVKKEEDFKPCDDIPF